MELVIIVVNLYSLFCFPPSALEVCVFMKDGSVHELYLENAWTEHASELLLKVEDCLAIPPEAKDMFALWITSPLLREFLLVRHSFSSYFGMDTQNLVTPNSFDL